jgi:adenylate cyclase
VSPPRDGEEPRDGERPPSSDDLARQNARLARRIGQLENVLSTSETLRDTNARVLDNVMGQLDRERARSRELLRNILPDPIIERLDAGETVIADRYEDVVVVFSDLVDFTRISAALPVATVVSSLNAMFSSFDAACARFGVEKIKTIGDAYLAAAGLPGTSDAPAEACADLAIAMREAVAAAGPPWQVRIGVHQGPVVAGVIGTTKYVYDIWGDAVNTASRLETTAPPGSIQVSSQVASALGEVFRLEPRGEVDLKGKGATSTFLLVARAGDH